MNRGTHYVSQPCYSDLWENSYINSLLRNSLDGCMDFHLCVDSLRNSSNDGGFRNIFLHIVGGDFDQLAEGIRVLGAH